MLPHMQWVWLQSDVKDRGPLREGKTDRKKTPSGTSQSPLRCLGGEDQRDMALQPLRLLRPLAAIFGCSIPFGFTTP